MREVINADPKLMEDLTKSTLAFIEDVRQAERSACDLALEAAVADFNERCAAVQVLQDQRVIALRQGRDRALAKAYHWGGNQWRKGYAVGKSNGRLTKTMAAVLLLSGAVLGGAAVAIVAQVIA